MINGKSNTRGTRTSRAVVLLLLVGFCVAIFAPTASAVSWTPETWSRPYQEAPIVKPEYDDGGYNDQDSKSGWDDGSLLGCFDIRVTAPTLFLYFLNLMDGPDAPDQGNGNDRQSLDHDRTTAP